MSLITTQICYDVGLARKDQKTIKAPIHVIQSNTKEISEYILPDGEHISIPGHPKIVVHADPERQGLFIHYPAISITPGATTSASSISQRYSLQAPKETFTFMVKKGRRKDSYTITHWELNGIQDINLESDFAKKTATTLSESSLQT